MCKQSDKPSTPVRERHVHADLIIAWANGAEIEWSPRDANTWKPLPRENVGWHWFTDYRLKPKPPVKKYLYAFQRATGMPKVSAMYFENDAEAIEYLESYEGFSHTSIRWVQRIDASMKEFP